MIRNRVIRLEKASTASARSSTNAASSANLSIAELSWNFLTEYSKSQGLGLEFAVEPAQPLKNFVDRAEVLAVRLPFEDSPRQLDHIPMRPADVSQVQGFDHWIFETKEFWSRILWAKTLRSLIVSKVHSLDIRQACLIVGEGPWVRLSAWVAAGLGYSKILIVSENLEDLDQQVKILQSILVGIHLEKIPADLLTLQTMKCSLLLNSLNLTENPGLMGDIGYFNFMSTMGLIVDLPVQVPNDDLLTEADGAGLLILDSLDLQANLDFDFLLALKVPSLNETLRSQFGVHWRSKT